VDLSLGCDHNREGKLEGIPRATPCLWHERACLPQSLQTVQLVLMGNSFGGRHGRGDSCRGASLVTGCARQVDSPLLVGYDKCSAEVRGEKCLADKGRRRARCVMKAIVKIKLWPLIVVGLVWLFGTIVPFANGIVRLLYEAVTEIVGAVFPGVLNSRVHRGRDVARTAGAGRRLGAESILRTGLAIATITGVGLLIELSWLLDRRHSQRPKTWICHACSAGNHQQCRGALLLVSRAREGARPCQCEHCKLNR